MRSKQVTNKIIDKKDEPILHVGQDPLNPTGNCIDKFGSTVCTPWDSCTSCDSYKGLSKQKWKCKKDSNNSNNSIVSDDEKKFLGQFCQQTKPDNDIDVGPI